MFDLLLSLRLASLFFPLYSSQLTLSPVGPPSCHIVLERVLNSVLSFCHPVFSPTIHPSIHSSPSSPVSEAPVGFLDDQSADPYLSPCVRVCVFVCVLYFENVTNARLGFTGEQSWSGCRCCQPRSLLLSLSLSLRFFFFRNSLCTLGALTDVNMNGHRRP